MKMTLAITTMALSALGAHGCTPHDETPKFVSEPVWVVSDDPCAYPYQSATVPAGSDYSGGVWFDPNGVSIGWSSTEDGCVNLATDDLAVRS
jgi:hypothetical protein